MDEKNLTKNPAAGAGETYHRGPVILRGPMIPTSTTSANLLSADPDTDWLHMDPWRVLRIQAEFVDGFGALAELGPAVTVLAAPAPRGRTPATRPRAVRASSSPRRASLPSRAVAPASWRRQTAARPRRAASPSGWA